MAERPPRNWTDTEQLLRHAYRRGERLDLRTGDTRADDPARSAAWPRRRTVRAEVLTRLLLQGPAPEPGRLPRLDLMGARISGRLDLTGAQIGVPAKFHSCGFAERVLLDYAQITWWNLNGSHVPGIDGEGLRVGLWFGLRDATVDDELWLLDARFDGGLDLAATTFTGLEPTADCPAPVRLGWLAGHVTAVSPAVHAQVAAAYRAAGQEQAARDVLIRKERARYQSLGRPGRIWGRLLDAAVGYGYRPARALAWLLGLIAAGTTYFTLTGPPRPVSPGGGPAWDPLVGPAPLHHRPRRPLPQPGPTRRLGPGPHHEGPRARPDGSGLDPRHHRRGRRGPRAEPRQLRRGITAQPFLATVK
ncbi:hypothetical protein AB0C76_19360 [Kitasatospora sp. NPDC048722]|uniref:hypothetical protein n=1 Tax=Kitasatospora sp. NPDC048722 TaxID=3155639 RepID=UPI0034055316